MALAPVVAAANPRNRAVNFMVVSVGRDCYDCRAGPLPLR